MLKALTKKQFMELFRTYFVNKKTGKANPKWKVILFFGLFALLMLYLCAMFFGMSLSLGSMLISAGMTTLYFSIIAIISVALGVFGSVFNTYAGLYLAKDNDLLISMPIPSRMILLSRLIGVYGLSLLYSGCVWLPGLLYYWIFFAPSVTSVVFGVLELFLVALFVSAVTCVLGWLVALIASRLKKKSFLVVIISLVFLIGYYMICFRMGDFFVNILNVADSLEATVKTWLNVFYLIGDAAAGSATSMALFTVLTLALAALCFCVLSRSFFRIATRNTGEKKVSVKSVSAKQIGLKDALLRRELKRFTSSATYMLNCALGSAMALVAAVALLVKRADIRPVLEVLAGSSPELASLLSLAPLVLALLLGGMNTVSTPSVSLEGKNLWLIQSLPVDPADVLETKCRVHTLVTAVPAALSAILMCVALRVDYSIAVYSVALTVLFVRIMAILGLMIGLRSVNLIWTNEVVPIKQSIGVLISTVSGLVLTAAIAVGAYFLRNTLKLDYYLIGVIVLLALALRLLDRWVRGRGARIFAEL